MGAAYDHAELHVDASVRGVELDPDQRERRKHRERSVDILHVRRARRRQPSGAGRKVLLARRLDGLGDELSVLAKQPPGELGREDEDVLECGALSATILLALLEECNPDPSSHRGAYGPDG